MKDFNDLFITLHNVSSDHLTSPFWILAISFSALLVFMLIAWGMRFYKEFNNLQQEHFFVERVASLAGNGWAAIWKDSGIVQSQVGLSNYLLGLQKPRHIDDFAKMWVEADQEKWLQFLQGIEAGSWKGKSIVLKTMQFNRALLVRYYQTKKNFKDIYIIKAFEITADLNHAHILQGQNNELKQKDIFYKQHLDAFPFPVWHRDEHMALTFCNQAYLEACEMPVEEVFQQNRCLWIEDDNDETMPLLFQPLKKELLIHGERKVYLFHEFQDAESDTYYGFALDLTPVENLKADFNRHIAAYREVLDNISAGVSVYGPDCRIKYFNSAYARLFEMNQKWLLTEPTLGEILDDLRARRLLPEQADYASFKKEELQTVTSLVSSYEEFQHLPDERSFRKIAAPHPLGGSFYVFEDVTAALSLERQYNTQLAVQRATLDNLYEGIAVFGSDNRLRFTNPAFERLWRVKDSYNLHDYPHMVDLLDIVREQFDEVPDWNSYKLRILNRVTDRVPKKRRLFRKDGTVMDFSYVPLPDGSHLISYVDMTDSCRVEKILRERNEALETADHMRTAFITKTSDDLKQPINTVIETVRVLIKEQSGLLNDQQQVYCSTILQSATKLLNTMEDIQDIVSLGSDVLALNLRAVSTYNLMSRLYHYNLPRAQQRQVNLQIECEQSIGEMIGDEMRLMQMLQNLLSNLLYSAQPTSKVILKAERQDPEIIFSVFRGHNDEAMPDASKIPLEAEGQWLVDPLIAETSIGLSVINKIIEIHSGILEINTLPNAEILINIRLPLQPAQAPQQLAA